MIRPLSWLPLLAAGGSVACFYGGAFRGWAKELDGVYTPAAGPCPTVEEQIQQATLPSGYELRCFASEPMVVNPVAMTWDHRGRLWVVELYEYPMGAKKPNEYSKTAVDEQYRPVLKGEGPDWPRDRVVILEDTDNDGVADKRTVFVDGLNLATSILVGHGGVFIGQAPNLFFFRDTDGDDVADEYKAVLTGFGLEDRHELLNSMTWGPDGRMYFTHGVFTHSKIRRPGEPAGLGNTLNAGIYRVGFSSATAAQAKGVTAPHVSDHEVFADGTSNPWGCDFDAAGNWFVEACVIDHLFHMAPGGLYARQGGAPENPYAYELLPSIVPKNHPKHFRAAYAGIQIYQGSVYPEDTHGHLFFGNIHDNSVHQERVEPVGATFKAHIVRDFLRANNGWFRPVSVQTGPDGFLWVMDWCDKYPCYQNALANPAGVDREKGRIWRIVYTGESKGKPLPSRPEKGFDASRLSQSELVSLLKHPNNWMRRVARQLLLEKGYLDDSAFTASLEAVARKGVWESGEVIPPAIRQEYLWTALAKFPHWETQNDVPVDGQKAFTGLPASLRVTYARALGEARRGNSSPWVDKLLTELAADEDPAVRHAVAVALRYSGRGQGLTVNKGTPPEGIQPILETLIRASTENPNAALPFAIWMALEPSLAAQPHVYVPWFATLAPQARPLSQVLSYKLMRRLCDTGNPDNIELALDYLDRVDADGELLAWSLDALVKGQEAGAIKPKRDPASYFKRWGQHEREDVRRYSQQLATLWGDSNAIAAVMGAALSETAPLADRIAAIQTVRKLKDDKARSGIAKLLEAKTPEPLTAELIRAAAELGGLDFANRILANWENYTPALRTTVAEAFTSRPDWASRLLDAVEGKWVTSGRLDPSTLPVTVRRFFATQASNELKERAKALLGVWNESASDIKALISQKRAAALKGEPNLEAGRALFVALCATCHEFYGGGKQVGPELIGSGRSSLDALLNNVIDPNQIIGNGYQNIVVTTKDGRTLSGRVIEDTPTRVRLLGIGGTEEVIAREQIEKLEDTGVSLMPSGFGELPDEQFRDLIWFILAPPEEGPLTKDKKEALATPVTETAAASASGGFPPIDWESVSLWNPEWRVFAPEFEGTPRVLPEFRGRKNVLQLHPYDEGDRTKPAALERRFKVDADRPETLKITCGAHERGDWRLRVVVNGEIALEEDVTPAPQGRWREFTVPLATWRGQEVTIRAENYATGWAWEFSYWAEVRVE